MLAPLLVAAALAVAPAPSGLDIKVRASDPLKPVIVLTNNSGKACQVANTALGTVALTRVEQDGKAIAPIPINVAFPEGMETVLAKRLQTLEPGTSAELKIPIVKTGPTGQALEMVTWSEAGKFGSLFPIVANKPLTIDLSYSVAIPPGEKTRLCAPAFSSGSLGGTASAERPKWIVWAAAGAGALLLLLLAVFLLMRRKKTAAAAVLLLLAGAGMVAQAKPALADFQVDPSLRSAFDGCMATFREPGHDPAGLLPSLEGSYHVHILPTNGDENHTAVTVTDAFIFWDPNERHEYHGGGGFSDPCTTLYHEMSHAAQGERGTWSMQPCATSDPRGRTLPETEVLATRDQNLLRRALGMPERGFYGDIPLPDGPCKPPERPHRCEGAGCGDTNGDPHMLTFDHKRYDFQGAGEFVLTRSAEYQIQVRQEPWHGSRLVTINTAVAMGMGPDRLELRMTANGMALLVGGQPKELKSGKFGVAELKAVGGEAEIEFAKGPTVYVRPIGRWGLDIAVQPDIAHGGKLEGLLGDFDGDSSNDIKPKGGAPIKEPSFAALYPSYADSWRISQNESLFSYEPGTSTETYTDRKFPEKPTALEALPGRAAAEALCKQQGVTDLDVLAACIIDVALTGQADFARGAARGQLLATGGDWGGIAFTVRLSKADEKATVQFDGTQGQQVYVDVLTTLPASCGTLELRAPDGKEIRSGCMINGIGQLDSTTLPVTGKYTITVEARGGPGEARLRVITYKDQVGTVTPDGPATLVHLDKPGMSGLFTFTGRKDQKVYVEFSQASLPSQCGLLALRKPGGGVIRSGCVINGDGELDGTMLPEDGMYTIEVDPVGRNVGDVYMRLINAIDQHGTISVNGSTVIAKIGQPGGTASFTFTATAGQRIYVDATAATLPSSCGVLDLYDPAGGTTVSGCIINGSGGIAERDGYVLLKTGTYTLTVDPPGNDTGQVALKLRS
jgi:von Willebrand factor type D domain